MKSIQPRKRSIAPDDLENSFKQALSTPAPLEAKPEPTIEKALPKPKKVKKAAKKVVSKPKSESSPKRSGKTRVTIDLPDALYTAMEKNKEETGQNFTFFISKLLKQHFKGK